jgi:hypothetical protein
MNCGTCKYSRPEFANESQLECHRRAPAPYNAMVFRLGELIRDCAWSLRKTANIETTSDDFDVWNEVTEAPDYALWPKVERDEWCGDWAEKAAAGR